MRFNRCIPLLLSAVFVANLVATAQEAKPGILTADELKRFVPSTYFFRGQSAGVQLRNSAGVRVQPDKLILVGLVDTSGYASDVQAKYQGLLITEVKLDIGGKALAPGAYGFGFTKDSGFLVMDVGANDLVKADYKTDDKLARPVPLKISSDGTGSYRLYAGRKWVDLKTE
jgi:hypothetical protein